MGREGHEFVQSIYCKYMFLNSFLFLPSPYMCLPLLVLNVDLGKRNNIGLGYNDMEHLPLLVLWLLWNQSRQFLSFSFSMGGTLVHYPTGSRCQNVDQGTLL
jgi:hypothetical protein